ncbi:DUF4041 domain-containing protein [Sutcliffiella horikoshii]|uniref:DUF4041 domain-containing protein n=1 Tax=Sutcliffiella horikoshii TaxID=79883 RepID=UPI001F4725B1|nr:DUF4041 domain-containing protein [Sutcliffiella horikoshii]
MKTTKWYLSSWLIALCFAFSIFIVPAIIGLVLLIMQTIETKKIKKSWEESGMADVYAAEQKKENLEKQTATVEKELNDLQEVIKGLKRERVELEDDILLQSFGFYNPKYDLESSEAYKLKLEDIRAKQKAMVKAQEATNHSNEWTLDGSKQKGKVMNNNNIKLTINAFNQECDTAISKVTFKNVEAMEKRIKKAAENLNKVNKQNKITIRDTYIALKLDELYLAYEYAEKKEEEKEEQRQIKEQMREEEKVRREIEAMKAKIEKEEAHFRQEILALEARKAEATDAERLQLEEKLAELESKLALVEKDKENVMDREQNTRAGYVYVISNIGSFGEDVYKIGMTRRLEPFDRMKELGSASVPFLFDVHAMIFAEDAPKLENALHKAFHHRRMNKVNERKEFFRVSLTEIEKEVKTHHNKVVEFTKLAEAQEYRESLRMFEVEQTQKEAAASMQPA